MKKYYRINIIYRERKVIKNKFITILNDENSSKGNIKLL